jgi:antitoxin VapB
MQRDGDHLKGGPVRKRGLLNLLKAMKPLRDDFPVIDDPVPAPLKEDLQEGSPAQTRPRD